MKFARTLAVSFLAALSAPAFASGLSISAISSDGNGCPAGTFGFRDNRGANSFTLAYRDFNVAAAPARGLANYGAKTCRVRVVIDVPQGYSLGFTGASMTRVLNLSEDAAKATNLIQVAPVEAETAAPAKITLLREDFHGPLREAKTTKATVAEADVVWTACGTPNRKTFEVTSRNSVRAVNDQATAVISGVGLRNNLITQDIAFALKKCEQ